MTYKQAQQLKPGDKVKQKMHGYIMRVDRIEEISLANNKYINVYCKTESGNIMRHKHKEIILI